MPTAIMVSVLSVSSGPWTVILKEKISRPFWKVDRGRLDLISSQVVFGDRMEGGEGTHASRFVE